jgi:phosphoglycolate phosphatase
VQRPAALLFDLDGTLVDSKRDIADAVCAALTSVGRAPLPVETIVPMIGDGARALIARALGPDANDVELLERTLSCFQQAYAARPCVHTTLMRGAREALAIDVPRAVVTNKPRAITQLVLESLGIASAFGALYAGGDGPLKPAPDGMLTAAKALGVPVAQAWVVGDGPQDVLAGHAAGCFTVAVPGIAERSRVLGAQPHVVLASLEELPALVEPALRS